MQSHRQRGFTLIELLVTMGIAAILLVTAVPSFTSFQRNAELTSFANSMVAAVNAARGEAIKRGRHAMLTPTDSSNWSSGWLAFVDSNNSQAYDASVDAQVFSRAAAPSYLTISATGTASAAPPYMMFDASGYAVNKAAGFGSLVVSVVRNDVASGSAATQTRRIIISNTGRARVCTPATDATCTTTATQ